MSALNVAYQNSKDKCYRAIDWLAPNALNDTISTLDFDWEDLAVIADMYSRIPNSEERAQQLVDRLMLEAEDNTELYNYITFIKLLQNKLTIDDFNEHVEIQSDCIEILVKRRDWNLLRQILDKYSCEILDDHVFTDKVELNVIHKKLIIHKSCSWIRLFTLPFLAEIRDIEVVAQHAILLTENLVIPQPTNLSPGNLPLAQTGNPLPRKLATSKLRDLIIEEVEEYIPDIRKYL